MLTRGALVLLAAACCACAGCITWSAGTDREYPGYLELLESAKGKTIAVAAFSNDTGLERNRWGRRKVFMAVSGSLFGIVPWPWDLRLIWSPEAIGPRTELEPAKFDAVLTREIAKITKEETGFDSRALDVGAQPAQAGTSNAGGKVLVSDLMEKARSQGCQALYLVWYNEFTDIRFRTEIRRHLGYLQHRLKALTGFALVPSVAMFDLSDGRALLVRSNTAQRRNVYVKYFWAPMFTFGMMSPLDSKSAPVERFIKDVSAEDPDEARERCAYTLVVRDLTPKQIAYDDYEDQEQQQPARAPAGAGERSNKPAPPPEDPAKPKAQPDKPVTPPENPSEPGGQPENPDPPQGGIDGSKADGAGEPGLGQGGNDEDPPAGEGDPDAPGDAGKDG